MNQKIIAHKFEDDQLMFKFRSKDGQSQWVLEKTIKNHKLAQEYWHNLALEKKVENHNLKERSLMTIPEPKKLIEMKTFKNTLYILCAFKNFDTPVYVPVQFLRNSYPNILIDFFESLIITENQIFENPQKRKATLSE